MCESVYVDTHTQGKKNIECTTKHLFKSSSFCYLWLVLYQIEN